MNKTLFTGFSPNTRVVDVSIALAQLLVPWNWRRWKQGTHVAVAERMLQTYVDTDHEVITFDSGRSALYMGLLALGIGQGDEVLVQAFTCVVVINAIRWTGATPVYVDVDPATYNMDPSTVKKHITAHTKAIIIQHTFGRPADLTQLLKLAKEHGIYTVEDCAHSLGALYNGQLTGTFGDMAMLSFGGEKIISSVRGGALLVPRGELATHIRTMRDGLPDLPARIVFQHLMHVCLFPLGRALYSIGIGKLLLYVAKKLHITHRIITSEEKRGEQPHWFPARFPNALATLLIEQIPYIDAWNAHRANIARIYESHLAITNQKNVSSQLHTEGSVYLRYPVVVPDAIGLKKKAKESRILLGDWYSPVIGPRDTDMSKTGYAPGSCPQAELSSRHVVNLPTDIHISEQDARRVLEVFDTE